MSLNRTSLDTEVLILRRMYAMSTANIPVSTNYILGIGTAGQAYFQNTLQNISTYGIDLSSTISTIYGQIAAVSLSGGVSYPYFISTISGLLVYINSQDASIVSTFSTAIGQTNSTVNGLMLSTGVTQAELASTISGVYGYISTISTSQGATISTNYTTLSGQINSINVYNSTYSTNIGGIISSFDSRISTNTTNISTVNNYLDLRISSLSAAQISSYISLSTMIEQAIVSSAFDQLSSFSTQINNSLISTTTYLTNKINDVSSSLLAVSTQVAFNTYDIEQLSSLVSTNFASTNVRIVSTGQGVYNNPYFQANTTISGSLSMVTGGHIDASGSSTFTRTLHVSHTSTDVSSVILQVNNNYSKSFGITNTSRAIVYDLARYPSTNNGTLALYDINNNGPSTNMGSSIIFGGLYTDDKLWYRAKISAVAPPSADASGIYGAGDIVFTTKDNNNTLLMTDKMRIMHNGNVIIGPQPSTTQKLYVNGSATIESTITTTTLQSSDIITGTIQTNSIDCNIISGSPIVSSNLTIQNLGASFAPSLTFGTKMIGMFPNNTGIYQPSSNSIAVTCGGFALLICSTNTVIANAYFRTVLDASIGGNLSVSGNIISPSAALVPIGGIIMWSGSIVTIPGGWRICDGISGTPDLRDRFIVGAGSSYSVAATGGANQVTLDISQIPAHKHDPIYYSEWHNSSDGGSGEDSLGRTPIGPLTNITTNLTTSSAGGGQPHENRPPYYALAYIMRIV